MKIVFMGTPDFAVPSLEILVKNGFDVVGVITAPDKPSGRGLQLQESEVKKKAMELGLKILQPEKLKNEYFIEELKSLKADLQVVVAFRMLPEIVWNMPKYGTLNLHGSLLPDYRGAAPINWAMINGEKFTGVSTFFLKHEIDTGEIILQEKMEILEEDDFGSMYEKLKSIGAVLILKTCQQIEEGTVISTPQNFTIENKLAPKIFKPDCKINWSLSAREVFNFIRGLSPFPTAFTTLNGKMVKIFTSLETEMNCLEHPVGTILIQEGRLFVSTNNHFLEILSLQMEGKKRVKGEDFVRGLQIKENLKFE